MLGPPRLLSVALVLLAASVPSWAADTEGTAPVAESAPPGARFGPAPRRPIAPGALDLDWVLGISALTGPLPTGPDFTVDFGGRIRVRPPRHDWMWYGELMFSAGSTEDSDGCGCTYRTSDPDFEQLGIVRGSFGVARMWRAGPALFYAGPSVSLSGVFYERVRGDRTVIDDSAAAVGLGGLAGVQIDGGSYGHHFFTVEVRGEATTPVELGDRDDARLDRIGVHLGIGTRF